MRLLARMMALCQEKGKNGFFVSGSRASVFMKVFLVRYFQCQPRYGLFAPLPKVEKLASAADEGKATATTEMAKFGNV